MKREIEQWTAEDLYKRRDEFSIQSIKENLLYGVKKREAC